MNQIVPRLNRCAIGIWMALFLALNGVAFDLTYAPGNPTPDGVYFKGVASVLSNRFQLTSNVGFTNGSILLDNLPKTPIKAFTVQFGLRMTNANTTLADGVSFGFGPGITKDSVVDEKGITNGLAVAFDTYPNTSPTDPSWVPGISIRWNGVDIATTNIANLFNSSRTDASFHEVVISFSPAVSGAGLSTVKVQYQGVEVSGQVQYDPDPKDTWRMILAGRTGLYTSEQSIDRIHITGRATELTVVSPYGGGQATPRAGTFNPVAFEHTYDPSEATAGTMAFNGTAANRTNLFLLTPNTVKAQGSIVLRNLPQVPIDEFTARIGLRMTNANTALADGVSFSFGPGITKDSVVDERGITNGLAVSFDTYPNTLPKDPSWVPGISIRWNGIDVASTNIATLFNSSRTDGAFREVVITLQRGAGAGGTATVTVQYQGISLVGQVPYAPATNEAWGVVFGARTGDAHAEQSIDRIHLSGTALQPVETPVLVGELLTPSAGVHEITEKDPVVLHAPQHVYLDAYRRELDPTTENIESIARYRARLADPAATVTPSGSAAYGIQNGAPVDVSRDTKVTWNWVVENLAEVDPGTSGVTSLAATDITDPAHVDTLGRRYLPPGTTGFDSLVNRSVVAAQQGNVRFGSRGYVMENAPNSPERYLELAGEGDHLRSTAATPVLPAGATRYTLEFWARRNVTTGTGDQVVIGLGSANGAGKRLLAGFGGDQGFFVSDGATRVSAVPGWTDEQWHHWAAVCLGNGDTNSVALYRDGVLVKQSTAVLAPFAGDGTVTLGARAVGDYGTAFFPGGINNVRVWGRPLDRPALYTALTTKQFSGTNPDVLLEMPFDTLPTSSTTGVHVERLSGPAGLNNVADIVVNGTLQQADTVANFTLPSTSAVPVLPSAQGTQAWHHRSRIVVATSGRYLFRLQANGPAQFWLDGQPFLDKPGSGSDSLVENSVNLTPGGHVLETWVIDAGSPRSLSLTWSANSDASSLATIPDASLLLAASDLLASGQVTLTSTDAGARVFVARGFEGLFPANTSAATMLAALLPGFRLGLTALEGGQNTVQVDPTGKAPLDDWRRVFWGWNKEYQFKVGVQCSEPAGLAQISKLPYFAGEVAEANVDGATSNTAGTLGGGVVNVLEIWLREGERLAVGTVYRTADRRYSLNGITGNLNVFGNISVDTLVDAIRSQGVSREYSFPAVFGPGSLNFTYARTIHRVNLALGQGLDVSTLDAANAALIPELPVGSVNLRVDLNGPQVGDLSASAGGPIPGGSGAGWAWDYVGKRWYPTKPGLFSLTWPDAAGYTNTIEVSARFPGDTETRSGFLGFENKDGTRQGSPIDGYLASVTYPGVADRFPGAPQAHYLYNVSPNGVTPAPADLDPRADDAWFFKDLAFAENGSAQLADNRRFSDSRVSNRSVLVFTRRPDAKQVATGNLALESVTVRVLNTGTLETTGTAVVGERLESPSDKAGFHSGRITPDSANYNPLLYATNAATVGQWGPIYPVNRHEPELGQKLSVDWYDTAPPQDPIVYLPKTTTRYDLIRWPDATDPATPVIYISSQMGSEGVGQAVATNGIPNYQDIFDPTRVTNLAVYHQPVAANVGYNPNEEHAFIAPSKAYLLTGDTRFNRGQSAVFALQNRLNTTNTDGYTSNPFVLVQYGVVGATNASDAFAMKAYAVQTVRMNETAQPFPVLDPRTRTALDASGQPVAQPANPRYDFDHYTAVAGSRVAPPYPLDLVIGNLVLTNTLAGNLAHVTRYTTNGATVYQTNNAQRVVWQDKNGVHWVVSGGDQARFFERYFYPLRADFWMDGKPVGSPVAWSPPGATPGAVVDFVAPAAKAPVAALYAASWGSNYPVLKKGESLTYAGGEYKADHPSSPGLPAVVNMASAEVVFDDSTPAMLLEKAGPPKTNWVHRPGVRILTSAYKTWGWAGAWSSYINLANFNVLDTNAAARSLTLTNLAVRYSFSSYVSRANPSIDDPARTRRYDFDTELLIDTPGNYTFYLTSGSGCSLMINGQMAAELNGINMYKATQYPQSLDPDSFYYRSSSLYGYQKTDVTVYLPAGYHLINLTYINEMVQYKDVSTTDEERPKLVVEYASADAGIPRQVIPADKLFLDPEDPTLADDVRKQYTTVVQEYVAGSARVTRPLDRYATSLGKEAIPGELQPMSPDNVLVSGSRWYYKKLPASLGKRFYYDSLTSQLVFRGRLNDLESGAPELTRQPVNPYVLEPNFLTEEDVETLKNLDPDYTGVAETEWTEAIEKLHEAASTAFTTGTDTGLGVVATQDRPGLVTVPFYDDTNLDLLVADGVGEVVPVSSFGIGSALVANPTALERDPGRPAYLTLAENNDPRASGAVTVHVLQLAEERYRGSIEVLTPPDAFSEKINLRHTGDFGGNTAEVYYQWWVHDVESLDKLSSPDDLSSPTHGGWQIYKQGLGLNAIDFEGDPRTVLADKFFFVRYGGKEELQGNLADGTTVAEERWRHVKPEDQEPDWAPPSDQDPRVPFQWAGAANSPQLQADGSRRYIPQLVMGWVKRILDQINPYEARFSATFNGDAPATYSSMLQQAGGPYVGPVALNADKNNLENVGLIQLYETVLQRAKDLTQGIGADAGTDQALLLAATRLASLYGLLGNEAWSDAQTSIVPQSPDMDDDAASSLFAFKNEVATPLDEQLALLRGTDFLKAYPSFNRLFWNYLKADGEAAYNAVYNISDANQDGLIDESDAALLYPMGHGDAWGHYLSAVKMHYDLLRRPGFTWQARAEYYSLLGNVLPVDYLDEKTFATLAAARARAGVSVVKATYAQSYSADPATQWQGYTDVANPARAWGVSEWTRRTGQGALFDWLAANAMTPAPVAGASAPEGLDRIDRAANQAEVASLVGAIVELQQELDNANRGQNPIGLDPDAMAFDVDPFFDGVWWERAGQFDQVYARAVAAANNALAAYNFARRSDQQLRRIANDTSALKMEALKQDLDYQNRLIAIYGRPYQGTIGPGQIFAEGYQGPDLVTYLYMDVTSPNLFRPEIDGKPLWETSVSDVVATGSALDFNVIKFSPNSDTTLGNEKIARQFDNFFLTKDWGHLILNTPNHEPSGTPGVDTILKLKLPISETSDFAYQAPTNWGSRTAYGEIQAGLRQVLEAQTALDVALEDYGDFTRKLQLRAFHTQQTMDVLEQTIAFTKYYQGLKTSLETVKTLIEIYNEAWKVPKTAILGSEDAAQTVIPDNVVAVGGDLFAPAAGSLELVKLTTKTAFEFEALGHALVKLGTELSLKITEITEGAGKETIGLYNEFLNSIHELAELLAEEESKRGALMAPLQRMYFSGVTSKVAEGERLQAERAALNRQIAASAQRNRYADLIVRLSRNEAARKFDAALDNALRYAWLAAKAYDYETSLSEGHPAGVGTLLDQIVQTRSLGLWQDGEPQVGNGGLADLLARLKANHDAIKGQIGLNNAQFESGQFSLRSEAFRISTDDAWVNALKAAQVPDLWQVPEFRQYCRPFDAPTAGPQPGLVISFSTEITPGRNFFGRPLSALDHAFSGANYATKIRDAGVAFTGYDQGGTAGLSSSPRVYLIPVGQDVQRCSDSRFPTTRTWNVVSQRIPMPYVLNTANLSDPQFQPSMDGLDGSFVDRIRFGDFRAFTSDYELSAANDLTRPPVAPGWSLSARLYGRSVWNTRWLLIVPGATLGADKDSSLDRFIHTVTDIKLVLQTYSNMGM